MTWSNTKTLLMIAAVAYMLIGAALQPQRGPREGDRCGPGHRWVNIGVAGDYDLSCESE